MSEPVRFTRIAGSYSATGNRFRPGSPADNTIRDTVQISSEAREKSKEYLLKLKAKPSPEKPTQKPPAQEGLDILRISANATREQVRKAYLAAIKRYHPDNFAALCPEFRQLAEEKSKQINLAYQKLTGM